MRITGIRDKEDAVHIVIAWMSGADYFITTDRELYRQKKTRIEEALNAMSSPLGRNCKDMRVLNPVDLLRVLAA